MNDIMPDVWELNLVGYGEFLDIRFD